MIDRTFPRSESSSGLVLSQVIRSFQLPFAGVPLISPPQKMGEYAVPFGWREIPLFFTR